MLSNEETVPPQTGTWVFLLCLVTGTTLFLVIGFGMWAVFGAPLPGNSLLKSRLQFVFTEVPHFSFVYMPVLLLNILFAVLASFIGFLAIILSRDKMRLVIFGVGFAVSSVAVTFVLLVYSYSV